MYCTYSLAAHRTYWYCSGTQLCVRSTAGDEEVVTQSNSSCSHSYLHTVDAMVVYLPHTPGIKVEVQSNMLTLHNTLTIPTAGIQCYA